MRLNCNCDTKIRKEDSHRGKIPPDIILEAVRVKIHNLSIRQGFNMKYYRALSDYCKKS